MKEESVQTLITIIRQNNCLLGMIDNHKDNHDIKLCDLLEEFSYSYKRPLDGHSFWNQYQMIASLYAYILIPKETYFDCIPTDKIKDLPKEWGLEGVIIEEKRKSEPDFTDVDLSLQEFIRHLRNSLAHGKCDFDEELNFHFEDSNGKKMWKITLSKQGLQTFLQSFSYWVITKRKDLEGLLEK